MIYDWHKFSRPRVALFNRVMAWVLPCIAVAIWVLCLRLAMHDWTVLLAPLIPTAATVMQRLALRKVYRAEPDYSAIARMEMESFGRTFEHAGAPSGQSASGTYAILRVTCNQGHDGRMWADGRGKTCPKCETRRGAFGTLNAMRRERRS